MNKNNTIAILIKGVQGSIEKRIHHYYNVSCSNSNRVVWGKSRSFCKTKYKNKYCFTTELIGTLLCVRRLNLYNDYAPYTFITSSIYAYLCAYM